MKDPIRGVTETTDDSADAVSRAIVPINDVLIAIFTSTAMSTMID